MNEIWNDDRSESIKAVYESMRLQTYFQFSLQVDKQHRKDFKTFCNSFMRLPWDETVEPEDNPLFKMTPADWEAKERHQ